MLLDTKKVAILGAGPVGLTLAKLLQQTGADVTVYERDKNAQTRIWGGTLDLYPDSGQKALKKAGLLDSYYALATPMGRVITDEQGNVLVKKEPALNSPEINRNVLRTVLLGSLTDGTVVWDRQFTELTEHNEKWQLHFANNTHATADVVIGANGGMSRIRQYITNAEVEYTGTFMLQGEVVEPETRCPDVYRLCDGNILMAAYKGNLLVANPSNNGVLTYNVIFGASEAWVTDIGSTFQDTGSARSFLVDRLGDWGDLYQQLFRSTGSFWGLPTKKMRLDNPWKTDRPLPITLVGDAAHLMPPFAGQGVNTGLMDALLLADKLTNGNYERIQAAIDDYEQTMIGYATEAQRESGENELVMRHPDFSFRTFIH